MGRGEEEKKRRERRVLGVYLVPGTCRNFEPLDVNLQGLIVTSHLSFSPLYSTTAPYFYSLNVIVCFLLFTVDYRRLLKPFCLRCSDLFGIGPTCMKPGTERRYVLIRLIRGKVIRAGEAFLSLFVLFCRFFFSGEKIPSGLGLECA